MLLNFKRQGTEFSIYAQDLGLDLIDGQNLGFVVCWLQQWP